MRLRFSLRSLLVTITLAAVAVYWCIVRPTAIANRFVIAVEREDYETAQSLYINKQHWPLTQGPNEAAEVDHIYAELKPWNWGDIWRCRRRILLTYHYQQPKDGRLVDWTTASDLNAKPNGVDEMASGSWQILL